MCVRVCLGVCVFWGFCSMKFDYIPIEVIKWFLHFISKLLFKVINRMVIFYDNNTEYCEASRTEKDRTAKRNLIQVDSFSQSDQQFEN